MPDMNENAETQQEYFGKKTEWEKQTKELEIQKEIEKYFTESTGFGRDKIRNFMDIVNKALKQKGERIANLEAQIEKMKCCENCQHWEGREPIPSLAEEGYYCFNDYPFECKRWELAEELKEIKENG